MGSETGDLEGDFRYRCEFCGELESADKLPRCTTPDVEEPTHCYACGEPTEFSSSQARKGSRARCETCIQRGRRRRFAPFKELAEFGDPATSRLVKAVEEINEALVLTLLEQEEAGLVDQARQLRLRVPVEGSALMWRAAYASDGRPVHEEAAGQPTTPLKMAVFRLSDCCLDEAALQRLVRIAQALVEHGASRGPAKDFFESRYGPAEPLGEEINAFTQLYAILST